MYYLGRRCGGVGWSLVVRDSFLSPIFRREELLRSDLQSPGEFLLRELHRLRELVLNETDGDLAHAAGFRQLLLGHELFDPIIFQIIQCTPPLAAGVIASSIGLIY